MKYTKYIKKNVASFFEKLESFVGLMTEKLILILYYLIGILLISLVAKIINKIFYNPSGWRKPKTSIKNTKKMY